ncbi:MAG: ATP-binding cassette domain-containing protein [Lachnospiraceae bacterium]|nr:ATP-binding cassette domain-containing protein [Lachnospiraceae bacterium]
MLEAKHLVKTFVRNEKNNIKTSFNAVDDISLEVKNGEIVGIIGPNGAGKTTLLRMLGNLMKPTSGEISIYNNNEIISDEVSIKKNIGYLSGNTKLYGRLTTRELLEIAGNIYGMSESEIKIRIDAVSKVLDMAGFIDNRIEKLSTGQTQRASISRCIIHNPRLYIFDEPTLGLDIISSNAIVDFMLKEKADNKAVLYSTHYLEEAEKLCDRIIIINKGKILASGTVDELKEMSETGNMREVFSNLIGREN